MSLFILVFIITVLLGISSIFLFVKRKRFGNKPSIISTTAFLISLIIVIPLGNQPQTDDYKKKASVFTYDRYLNESIPVGTIVKIQGQVTSLSEYTVDQEEVFILDGDDGTFYVKNNNIEDMEIKDGEIITIYGGYAGNGDSESPSINAQLVEK
ncbi:hypothetical protein [Metabacillus bambusae]|uniref:DUF3221 domain-containing protein n=1 Tax=Metabacillus bambusae TaxID=2795218 RepID=A0ABS3NBI8_9BACI|nr:hypothetical protein [Metabacillus bambusae]MBO1515656.1 hypothetical protein [Metabacillus bambusae]